MNRYQLITVHILLFVILFSCTNSRSFEKHKECVPVTAFSIDGIMPGDKQEKVIEVFGSPDSVIGVPDFPSFVYSNVKFHFCGTTLGSYEIGGKSVLTDSGLRTGMSYSEAVELLETKYRVHPSGFDYLGKSHRLIVQSCESINSELQLEFSENKKLQLIVLGWDCP